MSRAGGLDPCPPPLHPSLSMDSNCSMGNYVSLMNSIEKFGKFAKMLLL